MVARRINVGKKIYIYILGLRFSQFDTLQGYKLPHVNYVTRHSSLINLSFELIAMR